MKNKTKTSRFKKVSFGIKLTIAIQIRAGIPICGFKFLVLIQKLALTDHTSTILKIVKLVQALIETYLFLKELVEAVLKQ